MHPLFCAPSSSTIPLIFLDPDGLARWRATATAAQAKWVDGMAFAAKPGQKCAIPGDDGAVTAVLVGRDGAKERARDRFLAARHAALLPEGDYHLEGEYGDPQEAALGWALSGYAFETFRQASATKSRLAVPDGVDPMRIETMANAAALTQDLINTPANIMGPDALEDAARKLATRHGAAIDVTKGEELHGANLPMIHAVGRAAAQAPRLLDMRWGDEGAPRVTLVGKGVCFDTGGLNIKPGSSMGLMKKDMGGAANVIGLADMIMTLGLPVRLRVLIPAVENSISASAFRPGDILTSRKGLTVEVNNTDAEGRLVLADAIALGDEETPDAMFVLATLTGAARVALGPDLPPFYTDSEEMAGQISEGAAQLFDPLWRLPFWSPYDPLIEPGIADLDNAPAGGMAGSITAALFLRRFVENTSNFAHFDIYGWTPAAKPARPKGGACQAARAILHAIESRYGKA